MRSTPRLVPLVLAILAPSFLAGGIGQLAKLLPDDPDPGDQFGIAGLAVSEADGLVVVGVPDDDNVNGNLAGAAYVFDLATGAEVAKLLPTDGSQRGGFGAQVAIEGGTVLVGAPFQPEQGAKSGAAYLFDTATWTQRKLLPLDGEADDNFGYSVALADGIAAVGAIGDGDLAGAVYLFDAASGAQLAKLLPQDGGAGDIFGYRIAMAGGVLVVAAPYDDDLGAESGAAYLFDVATGTEIAKLLASDGQAGDGLGWVVDVDGTTALVSSVNHLNGEGRGTGAVYLFDAATGAQTGELLSPVGAGNVFFGRGIGLAGTLVVVGAPYFRQEGTFVGTVIVFDTRTGLEVARLSPDGLMQSFAWTVTTDGQTALIGAPTDDTSGSNAGSAYLFGLAYARTAVRNGIGVNPVVLASTSSPALGAVWQLELDATGHDFGTASVLFLQRPLPGLLLGIGELLVDPTSELLAALSAPHTGGLIPLSLAVPPDPSLCGFELSLQGLLTDTGSLTLTNALDAVVGY